MSVEMNYYAYATCERLAVKINKYAGVETMRNV